MSTLPSDVANFFLAMQAGRSGSETMARLFAEDAEYEEPFSGQVVVHQGREAILQVMLAGWATPLPDIHLSIDRVETRSSTIMVDWTCHSPALPNGLGQGRNVFEMAGGLIVRLTTTLKTGTPQ